MKFSAAIVSFALLLAGSVQAAHISNLKQLKEVHQRRGANVRRSGVSATYSATTTASVTASATASSSAPSSTSTSSGSSAFSSGIKRGLSFNDASLTNAFTSSQASWAYNWGSSYSGSLPDGVAYIPMLWSDASEYTDSWEDNANTAIANGATYLLAFNEPDLDSQANMTPEAAAAAWKTYMEPFAGKAKLVSPAVTNGASPMGEAWLEWFIGNCTDCTIDAVAMHIYDSASNEAYYQEYTSGFVDKFDKPVWITEFGVDDGSTSQQESFLSSMVSYLDNLDGVETYSWFMVESGNLVNSDVTLTSLGTTYIS
ncbi:glycoside hydrolase family 128 protein [Laetiporus sulphureus 93-53]|uniref:Glycoside hydrolase family 128 protein n=1 Tax=Laetiporus sulphureus 93-53 TaxID=1314785 RepID=A0A165EBH7_9APHY|nr:glycoside hydrolase family 128 protein [Laetiporus sulphureus 93-53]KZT06664.1 glycoside hydrolase family 128 protein [Laetiporus sulphureus 93-53]